MVNRKDAAIALILVLLSILSWLPRLRGPVDLRSDASAYYVLGTSLAEGKGYRLLNEPGEIQTTLHAPLLPMIVAVHQLALGTSDFVIVGEWLRVFQFVAFLFYAVASYFMLRRFLPRRWAAMATLPVLFNVYNIFISDTFYPELTFSLVTVLFTLSLAKQEGWSWTLLSLLLAASSFATRTIGVALLAAWALDSFLRRRFKPAVTSALVALALVLGWAAYIASVESSAGYRDTAYEYQRSNYNYINVSYAQNTRFNDPFSPELGYASPIERATHFMHNLALMPTRIAEAVTMPWYWESLRVRINRVLGFSLVLPWMFPLALVSLSVLIVGGMVMLARSQQYFVPLYILFSIGVISMTPWPEQFSRYLAPLVPFLALSMFVMVRSLLRWLKERRPSWSRAINLGFAAWLLTCYAPLVPIIVALYTIEHDAVAYGVDPDTSGRDRIGYRLFFYAGRAAEATDKALDWLRRREKGHEIVAATDPQWVYLRTGLRAVLPPFEIDSSRAQLLLDSVPASYLIVDQGYLNKYTARVVEDFPHLWKRVYTIDDPGQRADKVEIYERVSTQ